MAQKNKSAPNRYDLPSSRVLIRSLRVAEKRLAVVAGPEPEAAGREALENAILSMVRDLFLVRLLEEKGVVENYYLCGGKRSQTLSRESAIEGLDQFNRWSGWDFFNLEAWREVGPGDELAELDHELHLSRFWPPGMPAEIVGALWEERLPAPKRSGVYYTPRAIVDLALERALPPDFDPALPMRLLDPACGSGYFLLAALRRLHRRELETHLGTNELFAPLYRPPGGKAVLDPARRMELFADRIFGVDLDEGALELCRRAVWVEVLAGTPALTAPAPSSRALFENLKLGDSILEQSFPQQADLFEPEPPPLKPFIYEDETAGFGRIMLEGGFTHVIGNPPWISLKGRHKQAPYSSAVVRHLIERYHADTYRPNVVEFFIRRAVELMDEEGINVFVVPDRIAENGQYDALRQFMLEHGEIQSLHFREPFPGVAADTLIYAYRKRSKPRRAARFTVTDASGFHKEVTQNYFLKAESCAPAEPVSEPTEEILRKIESAGRRSLADFLETGVGFIARAHRITPEQVSDTQRPVIKGEHLTPYRREGSSWFDFTLGNLAGGTRSVAKLTKRERILLRKTGARLIAAIDRSGDLPEQSVYFAFSRERRLSRSYDLRYFLGILNSRVMSYYFRRRKITNRGTTPQIKKVHLDSLPIRPINFGNPEVASLHDRLVQAVQEREQATIPETAARCDDEIERLVALLYGLEDEELELIRQELNKGWP